MHQYLLVFVNVRFVEYCERSIRRRIGSRDHCLRFGCGTAYSGCRWEVRNAPMVYVSSLLYAVALSSKYTWLYAIASSVGSVFCTPLAPLAMFWSMLHAHLWRGGDDVVVPNKPFASNHCMAS